MTAASFASHKRLAMLQPSRTRPLGSDASEASDQLSIPLCDDLRPLESHSSVTGSSDADLIAAVIAGNLDSFSLLVRRHQDTCVRYAVRMLGSRVDADDVLQSAFMRAFRNLRSCRDRLPAAGTDRRRSRAASAMTTPKSGDAGNTVWVGSD